MGDGKSHALKRLLPAALVLLAAAGIALAALPAFHALGYRGQAADGGQPEPVDGGPGRTEAASAGQPGPYQTPERPDYQALYPDLYAPEAARSTVYEEKTVYLTFDNGPSERTPEVLEILARYGVQATFFVNGREDEQSRRWLREISEAGHTLGLHSYSHDYTTIYASVEAFLEDCDRLGALLLEATGERPRLLRFPGGSVNAYNTGVYQELIAEMTRRGFVYFDWNLSSDDASPDRPDAETVAENALAVGTDLSRAVVLLHDSAGKAATVAALPAIIEGYQALGYTFKPLTPEVVPVIFGYAE